MLALQKHWYKPKLTWLTALLLPLSWLFKSVITLRSYLYRRGFKKIIRVNVPVIVVGNVSVGGTGKTPFVIWLADYLKQHGWRPGIVSRGVGGKSLTPAHRVLDHDQSAVVGDESLVLIQRTHCPVVIGVDRVAAVSELLATTDCNIVISDDGLQHTRLGRDIEIVMVDNTRRFGNRALLPAGPLREPLSRLPTVDFIVSHPHAQNGENQMSIVGDELVSLNDSRVKKPLAAFKYQTVHAVAGIGNPERFFATLIQHGIIIIEHAYPDHYLFAQKDLEFSDNLPIIMTEKDAVKCKGFNNTNAWYLPIHVEMDEAFKANLLKKLMVV
jgi:tetraacyldisaccharide 4'-kinase